MSRDDVIHAVAGCMHMLINHDEDGCHVGDYTLLTQYARRCPCRVPASAITTEGRP